MKKTLKAKEGGFTLIEILVVIGIIAILAAVVLIAINPARQFAQANNSQRVSNINGILNAVGQYLADEKGDLPPSIDALTAGAETDLSSSGADVCVDIVPTYMPALPTDPKSSEDGVAVEFDGVNCGTYDSGYTVEKTSTGRIIIRAPLAELEATIEVTR